jgi:hypothetical protein
MISMPKYEESWRREMFKKAIIFLMILSTALVGVGSASATDCPYGTTCGVTPIGGGQGNYSLGKITLHVGEVRIFNFNFYGSVTNYNPDVAYVSRIENWVIVIAQKTGVAVIQKGLGILTVTVIP